MKGWGLYVRNLVLVAALGLSGCLVPGQQDPPQVGPSLILSPAAVTRIQIPFLQAGDAWLQEERTDGEEDTEIFPSARILKSTVLEFPGTHSDRFGNAVPALLIQNSFDTSDERYGGVPISYTTAVDAVGGTWIVGEASDYLYSNERVLGVPPLFAPTCHANVLDAGIPKYQTVPIPIELGTLMGAVVERGEIAFESGARNLDGGNGNRAEIHLLESGTASVSLSGKAATLPSVTAMVKLSLRLIDPQTNESVDEIRTGTLTYVHGVPVPVFSSWRYAAKVVNTTLIEFSVGTSDFEVGRETPVARYFPREPTWQTTPINYAPETASLNLKFPLEDALAVIDTDPRAAPVAVWLVAHPEAYVWRTYYEVDVDKNRAEWWIHFADGKETISVAIQRETSALGTVDSVRRADAYARDVTGIAPSPQLIASLVAGSGEAVLSLRQKTYPVLNEPTFMSTLLGGSSYSGEWLIGPGVYFFFGEMESNTTQYDSVWALHSKTYGSGVYLDATNGAVIGPYLYGDACELLANPNY